MDWADKLAEIIVIEARQYDPPDARELIAARLRLLQAETARDECYDIYRAKEEARQ